MNTSKAAGPLVLLSAFGNQSLAPLRMPNSYGRTLGMLHLPPCHGTAPWAPSLPHGLPLSYPCHPACLLASAYWPPQIRFCSHSSILDFFGLESRWLWKELVCLPGSQDSAPPPPVFFFYKYKNINILCYNCQAQAISYKWLFLWRVFFPWADHCFSLIFFTTLKAVDETFELL